MKKQVSQNPPKESFPNPTIIEALCELHFSKGGILSEDDWDGKWFGRFLTQLGGGYEMEPKLVSGVQIQTNIGGESKISSKPVDIGHMIYRCLDDTHLIQLTPWKLTINEIKKYNSWPSFYQHIEHAWKCFSKLIDSIKVNRIGMRYINRIPRNHNDEAVSDWIKNNDLIPEAILNQSTNFFYRCELQKKTEMKLLLTLAEDKSSTPSSLIFDIDMVEIKDVSSDWKSVFMELDTIHKAIKDVFDSSRTDKYTQLLNTRP